MISSVLFLFSELEIEKSVALYVCLSQVLISV